MQHRAVGVGAQDDVAEFLRRAEPPLRLQIELELLVVVDRSRLRLVRRWVSNQILIE
jgi:hypothetical protein